MQEMGAAMAVHVGDQVLLQDNSVSVPVHGGVLRKEINSSTAHSNRKASPHHDTAGMFHRLDCELALKAVGANWSPHLGPGGPLAPEGGLIRVHDFTPILRGEVGVGLGKIQPFLLHFSCEKRLHCCHSGRDLQSLQQHMVDGVEQDFGQLRQNVLHSRAARVGSLVTALLMIFSNTFVTFLGLPEPFLQGGTPFLWLTLAFTKKRSMEALRRSIQDAICMELMPAS